MNRRALVLTVVAALAASGCADNQTSVQLASICAPPDDAAVCSFSDTCDAQFIGITKIDVALTDRLWLFVEVHNQNESNADPDTYRTNTRDAYIEEVSTEYVSPFTIGDTRQRVGPFLVPANGNAVVSLFPITAQAAADIDAANIGTTALGIVAKVKAKGHYQDQSSFETAAMEVAVDVCEGCLDPNPCTTGLPVAVCPGLGQRPTSVACE